MPLRRIPPGYRGRGTAGRNEAPFSRLRSRSTGLAGSSGPTALTYAQGFFILGAMIVGISFFSFAVRFSQETIDEENAALAASLRGEDSSTGAQPVPA